MEGPSLTWQPIPTNTTELTYQYLLPVNLLLSLLILVHNTVILMDYFPDRRKFFTSLFMLIAGSDMLTAFGCILKAVPAVICLTDANKSVPSWLNFAYFPLSGTGYICSVFFTVVLSVTKAINIKNPFYMIHKTSVYTALVIGSCFWTALAVVGYFSAVSHQFWPHQGSRCTAQWYRLADNTATYLMAYEMSHKSYKVHLTVVGLEIVAFAVPVVIVSVCMVVQMYYIKKTLSSELARLSAESNRVNMTVFLVSMLFVVCTLLHIPDIAFLAHPGKFSPKFHFHGPFMIPHYFHS